MQLGSIQVSQQLFDQTRRLEEAWSDLEWTAAHYDEASDEQRAALDRVLAAIARLDDYDDD